MRKLQFDAVRIDHFLGFTRTWSIPADSSDGHNGQWVESPGFKLFAAVRRKLGPRPMIAEDLGHVTPADVRLRDTFHLAPMRIFQFGFGDQPDSGDHLPHNYPHLCAAYTGNHDNNTIVGWFRHLERAEGRRALNLLGRKAKAVHRNAIRLLMASPANVVIFPMQDVLGLGHRARMNIPGTVEGNWRWRLPPMDLAPLAHELSVLTYAFARQSTSP
jgi:4-alpha-glucanotransferase